MKKTSKTKEILAIIAICLCNYAIMHDMALVVITNSLFKAFPQNSFGVSIIVSGSLLIAMVGSLLTPGLLKWFSKKQLIVAASFIYAFTASFGAWKVNLTYMIVVNVFCALSQGVLTVCAAGLITDMFIDDEDKKTRIMGIYQASMTGLGMVLSMGAGFLAVTDWTRAYHAYYLSFPIAVLMIFFIPGNVKPVSERGEEFAEKGIGRDKKFGPYFWLTCLVFLLTYLVYIFAVVLVSIYIEENGIGSAALTGIASMTASVSSFIICLGLGFIVKKIGRKIVIVFNLFCVAGAAVMALFPCVEACIVGVILAGGAYGGMFAYSFVEIPGIVPPEKTDRAISIIPMLGGIASFGGVNLATALMKSMDINHVLLAGVCIGIAGLIIELIMQAHWKKVKSDFV